MAFLLRRKIHTKPHIFHQTLLYSTAPSIKSSNNQRIEKILIANRGEIACRIIKTAKRLGIRTVAVYSDADRDSLHVKSADEAFRIGPPPARLSYLNSSAIIEAANRSGSQVYSLIISVLLFLDYASYQLSMWVQDHCLRIEL